MCSFENVVGDFSCVFGSATLQTGCVTQRVIRSIELVMDASTDAAIRGEWATLHDAGLPSLATHAGASNRPHITLLATDEELNSQNLDVPLPLPVRLGGMLVFGVGRPRGMVLSRAVVPSAALLDLHARVLAASGATPSRTSVPGAWTPHITLARRLAPAELAAAIELLDGPGHAGAAVGLRLWDAGTRTVTPLAGVV